MSKLTCENFNINYFGYEDAAVNGFSAEFSGGFNVIFGESASGKTSLLKGLAGLIPSTGDVYLDGASLQDVPLKERDFQLLFDDYSLFSRHSVRYNLEYPLKIRKVPKAERRRMAEQAAALFDLDLMVDAPVYKINEWHKVALVFCRAYIRRAKVLFIDNVLSHLDLGTRRDAFYRFLPMFAGRGTIIYATDSAEEAAFLSDKIHYLNSGYLLQVGSLAELRETPACAAAFRAFNTCSSLFPAEIKENGISLFGTLVPFDLSRLIGENYLGKECLLGVRAEDFVLSDDGFSATVQGAFFSGDHPIYRATAGEYSVFFFSDKALPVGAGIQLSVRRAAYLFDALNERSVVR